MTLLDAPDILSTLDVMVACLPEVEVAPLSRSQTQHVLTVLAKVQGWVSATHAAATRHLSELATTDPLIVPAVEIAKQGHTRERDAQQQIARAETLAAVPAMEAALRDGDVSTDHVDVLARAIARLPEASRDGVTRHGEWLATIARHHPPEGFERRLRRHVAAIDTRAEADQLARQKRRCSLRHWVDPDTGMVCGRFELDPETGVRVLARIDAIKEGLFHSTVPEHCPDDHRKQDFLSAMALVALVDGPAATTPTDISSVGRGTEIVVVVDEATLREGLHERSKVDTAYGIELPVDTLRRWACSAGIVPAVLDGDGVALDVGRAARLATRHQRHALRAMYRTCAIEGCTVHVRHCEPHHIAYWRPPFNGRTDMQNLLPLCSRHHHLAHEGGWQLQLDERRRLTVTYPDGTRHVGEPPQHQWSERRRPPDG